MTLALAGERLAEADIAAVLDCLRSGWLTLGPRTAEFEAAFAAWAGAERVVAVASGAAALRLACRALGLGPGDEVIVPALCRPAAAAAVEGCGATPVPAPVASALRPVVAPERVAALITPRTRAVLVWHPWGYAADAVALAGLCAEHGLALIEDARDALGTRLPDDRLAGTAGALGCFSLRAGRQLGVGEGGLVVAAAAEHEARVRRQRSHAMTSGTWDRHRGHADDYDVVDLGFNHRMDEPRAALGLARLPRLAEELAARREVATLYRAALAGHERLVPCFDAAADARASPLCFPVLARDGGARDALAAALAAEGVETAAPAGSARVLLLPVGPHVGPAEVDAVAASLAAA